MSKHRSGKLKKSYLTELFPPVMRVMAGMDKMEDLVIPRTFLELLWTIEVFCTLMFPKQST